MDKSKLSAIAVAVLAAAGLAACGGTETTIFPVPDPTQTTPAADAFFSVVSGIVSTTSEDGLPKDPIDTIVATAPEDTQPEPVG
ncbi:hypothetical protein Q4S45_09525 [Massilia sp. R2A-15]|uniref:hypothetical protein n=1 Tax=Massilia sp. R2A-15 TaxID=3064278 RepID=UPI002736D7DC|nr:hypothetical protein [Massilia sp. R2A-15]WLI91336.1 hypothetical protein Q4S45_09525 [Massilia sp. R2A-15]